LYKELLKPQTNQKSLQKCSEKGCWLWGKRFHFGFYFII